MGVFTETSNQCVDLSKDWTSFIGSAVAPLPDSTRKKKPATNSDSSKLFFLLEASPPAKDTDGKPVLRDVAQEKVVKLSDLAVPVAWKPGKPFGILVQSSPEQFCKVGTAYIDGVLVLDDGLYVDQILTVDIKGQPFNLVDNLEAKEDSISGNKTIGSEPAPPIKQQRPVNPDKPLRRKHSTEFSKKREGKKSSKGSKMDIVKEILVPEKVDKFEGQAKPPNVLIYAGSGKNTVEKFERYCSSLQAVIDHDKYVVYHLKHEHALTHPWSDNCVLVVLIPSGTEALDEKVSAKLNDYLTKGGHLICIGQSFSMEGASYKMDKTSSKEVQVSYTLKNSGDKVTLATKVLDGGINVLSGGSVTTLAETAGAPLVVQVAEDRGVAVMSKLPLLPPVEEKLSEKTRSGLKDILIDILNRLGIKCHPDWQPPILTPGYLMGVNKEVSVDFHKVIQPLLKNDKLMSKEVSLLFTSNEMTAKSSVASDLLTILSDQTPTSSHFNFDLYKANLKSKVLGNLVLYTEVVPTTMTLFESFMFKVPETIGVVAIASRQTKGKGRGGNKWLAPLGCAMFTIHARIPVGTVLAGRLPFIQHIAALACVEAVRTKPGYESLDIRVKWPNDLYYSSKQKLGGMLVKSSLMDQQFHALIGIGFNVSNSEPTMCVNDVIRGYNKEHQTSLELLTVEEVIARTSTKMEEMVNDIQKNGPENFLSIYYKRWLHGDTVVKLESEDGPEVSVIGLDKSGFLEVKTKEGKLISLQPDGNSFDMLKNLITVKAM